MRRGPALLELGHCATRLSLDDGLWHTATARGSYALKLADVERGQAVLMGTIRESGEPTVLVARLGVEARRVTDADMDVRGRATQGAVAEIETLVIRDAEVAARLDEIGMPRHVWSEPVGSGWSTWEESLSSEPRD